MHGQVSSRTRSEQLVAMTAVMATRTATDVIERLPRTPSPADDSPVLAFLHRVLDRHATNLAGDVASYIPELRCADPRAFGIAIATVDGAVYEAGDTRMPFTIQSMSKPLAYAAILDLHGEAAVRRRIGVEPTGEAFNAITLEAGAGTPFNPMVNAGAIAAVGMVPDGAGGDRATRLAAACGRFAGRGLEVDAAVYASERDTGHRNRAIAHLLRSTGALDDDPDAVVDAYFRQCALRMDARDLALVAATLANEGVNPLTGERAASAESVRSTLSVMLTCGMYDGAGRWLFEVGMPAKSGVSGGIFAVLPGRIGIGVWSPRLDAQGNSVRGVAVCRDLVEDLGLHLMRASRRPGPTRLRTTVAATPSKRRRPPGECLRLRADAGRSLVLELHGSLDFVALEAVSREALGGGRSVGEAVATDATGAGHADPAIQPIAMVIDLRRVPSIDRAVIRPLGDLVSAVGGRGAAFAWSGSGRHKVALDAVDAALREADRMPPQRFTELDLALEWAEDVILSRTSAPGAATIEPVRVSLARHPAMAGLSSDAAERLAAVMERRTWSTGETLVRRGEPADSLLVITGGRLSVRVPIGGDESRRLATLEAGALVGELSFLGGERRTADVHADTPVEAYVLRSAAFAALEASDPATTSAFLEVLLRVVAGIARRLTDEVAELAS